MRRRDEARILPFPTPEPAEIVGVLPFEGGEVLVKVTTAQGGALSLYDPTTGVRVTQGLSSALSALRRGPSPSSSPLRPRNRRRREPAR